MEPTPQQLARVEERGYRSFLRTNEDGSQELIFVYKDHNRLEFTRRSDRWASWSAPTYFDEIYD